MASSETNRNLDGDAQNTQLRAGVIIITFALLLSVTLLRVGAGPTLRSLLFLPFFLGTYGVASALVRVCGFHALIARRITQTGRERIVDRDELHQLRRRGLLVIASSLLLGFAMTALLVVAPA